MFSLGSSLSEGRENEESMLSSPIVSFQTHGFLMVEKVLPNEHASHGSISQTYTLVLCSINHESWGTTSPLEENISSLPVMSRVLSP